MPLSLLDLLLQKVITNDLSWMSNDIITLLCHCIKFKYKTDKPYMVKMRIPQYSSMF